MTGWHTVHVRVNDAATGKPTPVRIRFVGPQGEYLAPFGRLTDFAADFGRQVGGNLKLDGKQYAYIDGSCEIRLPAEPVVVEVSKGPEYRPVRQEVRLGPGKLAIRIGIERWSDLRQERWYAGDTRAHFLSPPAALLEAAAEDLAIVDLLALEYRPSPPSPQPLAPEGRGATVAIDNILAFSGQQPALKSPGHLVVVNTLNSHPVLGELGLLNCHRVVYPLTFGGKEGKEDWTLAGWCDQCHRKGGLVLWNGFAGWEDPRTLVGEPLADLLLGKIDAVNVDSAGGFRRAVIDGWYKLLNAGLRVPLVAGSGKASNAQALGCRRTYAKVEELTYKNWIEAVRAGRVFVSRGPILSLNVDGKGPGDTIETSQPSLHVKVEARSQTPFERLELVHNGSALAAVEAEGEPPTASFEVDLPKPGSGWLAARVWEPDAAEPVAAHTGPIYLQVEGQPFTPDVISVAFLLDHIDRMLDWVEKQARFDNDKQRGDLTGVFQSARQELVKRMGG